MQAARLKEIQVLGTFDLMRTEIPLLQIKLILVSQILMDIIEKIYSDI
jgi:hypothetical protein